MAKTTRRFDADQRADPALPDSKRAAEILSNRPNSVDYRNSRYVQGGDVEIFPTRLGWWERRIIETADDDLTLLITSDFDKRPDLLAYNLYGKAALSWIILQYNNILDINTEFVAGKTITVPSPARVVLDITTQSTGVGLDPEQNIPTSSSIKGEGKSNSLFSPNKNN